MYIDDTILLNYEPLTLVSTEKKDIATNSVSGGISGGGVYVSENEIIANRGKLGGWIIDNSGIRRGNITINSQTERILLGEASAPLTGIGIFFGRDGSDYEFRAGDPTGDYIHWNGSNLTIAGAINASSGTIGGWTIDATSIYTGTEDHSGYTANAGDITIYSDGANSSIHAKNFYIDTSGDLIVTNPTITSIATGTDISLQEMTHNLVFSVTDADTIAWASGTIKMSSGATYSINAGNTGNMSALTYIYLDPDTSTTVLQTTTTYSTAVGAKKRLIGTAQNQTTTASFIPYGSGEILIDGDNVGTNSILTANIATNAITSTKINVTDLAAINADMGSITAGDIVLPSGGFIRSGQTAYDTGTGFYIGNDSGTPKSSIGNSSGNKMTWDGSSLKIVGTIEATATINAPIVRSFRAAEAIAKNDAVYVDAGSSHVADLENSGGENMYFRAANSASLNITGDISMGAWVKPESITGNHWVLNRWDTLNDKRSYRFGYNTDGKLRFDVSDDGTEAVNHYQAWYSDSSQLTAGTWTHIAMTFDISTETCLFYVDGVSVALTEVTGNTLGAAIFDSTRSLYIGVGTEGGIETGHVDGMIDEVRLWNDIRTPTEISDNYKLQILGATAGLAGGWTLDNILTDESGNGNTLTNNNAVTFVSTDLPPLTPVITRTDSDAAGTSDAFIGFAKAAITKGNTGEVIVSGIVTGFSGLLHGTQYYLSGTAGAISTSAGTVNRKAGIAVGYDELLITNSGKGSQ